MECSGRGAIRGLGKPPRVTWRIGFRGRLPTAKTLAMIRKSATPAITRPASIPTTCTPGRLAKICKTQSIATRATRLIARSRRRKRLPPPLSSRFSGDARGRRGKAAPSVRMALGALAFYGAMFLMDIRMYMAKFRFSRSDIFSKLLIAVSASSMSTFTSASVNVVIGL